MGLTTFRISWETPVWSLPHTNKEKSVWRGAQFVPTGMLTVHWKTITWNSLMIALFGFKFFVSDIQIFSSVSCLFTRTRFNEEFFVDNLQNISPSKFSTLLFFLLVSISCYQCRQIIKNKECTDIWYILSIILI